VLTSAIVRFVQQPRSCPRVNFVRRWSSRRFPYGYLVTT